MENNIKKELTLNDIAELIKVSANETTKTLEAKIESSVGELATMTQNHFLNLEKDIKVVQGDVSEMKEDIKDLKKGMDRTEAELNKRVSIISYNDLTYRVEKLEEKNGITFKKNLATA